MGCHFLFQGIFLTQESNPCLFMSPALAGRSLTTRASYEAMQQITHEPQNFEYRMLIIPHGF